MGPRIFSNSSNAAPPGIAGLAEVAKTAYPDPTQFDPKDSHHDPKALPEKPIWFHVDVRFVKKFPRLLSLDELRGVPAIADMPLFNRSRLSVQPVTAAQWKTILSLV